MISIDPHLTHRLHQGAQKADRLYAAVACRFVTGEERSWSVHHARENGVTASFDGGWPDAERVQVCFHPADVPAEFTGVWMEIRWNGKFSRCDHRDLLGSLMALGIDREYFGDLITQSDSAWLFTLPEIAARLPREWTKAGNTPIRVEQASGPVIITPPKGETLRDTVPSLRLDAILSSGMKTSRARAAEMIKAGLVAVDHLIQERTDKVLIPGQLLSVRGFGRIRLTEVGDPTRKERLPVTLEIFRKD